MRNYTTHRCHVKYKQNRTFYTISPRCKLCRINQQKKFLLHAMDDFILKSPAIYNFFYHEHTELNDTLIYEAQQQDPVIRQLLFWKRYKIPRIPSLNIRANNGLLH